MGNNGGSIARRAEDALEGVLLEGDASNVVSGRGVVAVEEMERRGPGEKGKRLTFAWLGSRAGDTIGRWALAILAGANEDAMRVLLQGLRDHHRNSGGRWLRWNRGWLSRSLLRRQRVGRWLRRGFDERWLCTTEDWVAVVAGQAIEAMTVTVAAVSVVSSTKVVSGEAQL
ncbi:hypothetical protein BHM03_00051762 [Ensete ventricosum]|nr:hypothetical protein BHM03_00051762 [Ensete ventricosum]